jgi:ABC-2 type transport system permease protein
VNGVLGRALRAEWTKLRTVRSTAWTCIAVVGATVGVSAFLAAVGGTDANGAGANGPGALGGDRVVLESLRGVWLGQVAIVAFGVIAATSEFATRTVRVTFAAIPRRVGAFGAKAAVVGAVALAVGSVASVLSFLIARPLLHGRGAVGYPTVSLSDPSTISVIAGTALSLTSLALLAVGVGTIVRHTAAAMTLVVASVLVPTVVMGLFTGAPRELLQRVTPAAGLASTVTSVGSDTLPPGPWGGLGVTAAWSVAALVIGAWAIGRRDA